MEKTTANSAITGQDSNAVSANRSLRPLEEFDRLIEGFFERSWMKPLFKDDLVKERLGFFGQHNPKVDIIDRERKLLYALKCLVSIVKK